MRAAIAEGCPRRIRGAAVLIAALLASSAISTARAAASTVASLKRMSLDELMNLEVTSVAKRAQRLAETASAIQVITQEAIRRSGATRLPEALRLATNLHVAQVDSRQWAISARGFNNTLADQMLVLMDGRTLYTPLFAGVFWDVQDTLLDDVAQIEVISGPGATLWGSNAVNGVISITTASAAATQGLLLKGGAGNALRGAGAVRYGGALSEDAHYRVYAKYSSRDETVRADGSGSGNDWRMGQGGFRLDLSRSADDQLTLQGDYYDGEIDQLSGSPIAVDGTNVLGRWSHTMDTGSQLSAQVYYDRTYRLIPPTFGEQLDIYDAELQHRLAPGARHSATWGLTYRMIRDEVRNSASVAFLPARVSRSWFSVFAQDEIALLPERLHLTAGLKVEHNEYTDFEFQPSVRVAWQLEERETLWAAISRAVRTPSRIDRELYSPGTPPYVLMGGPGFESETLIAYELGYRVQPYEGLLLAIATFYNSYDDLRSVERLDPSTPLPRVIANGQEGRSYGAEVTADYWVSSDWRLRAGFTQLDVRVRPKAGSTDRTFGTAEARDPSYYYSIHSSLDIAEQWTLDAIFRYVGRIASYPVPAYGDLDVRFAWTPSEALELSLLGQNLLHDQHPEFGAPATRHEIERSVYGEVTWRF